jgi:tRNA A-37 threonylcarbamoyl transferase component Bud32
VKFSSFNILEKKSQLFLTTRHQKNSKQHVLNSVLVDHIPSLVGILKDSGLVIKFIKARSWHEYIKLLWNHSRITKETKGSQLLQNLGLTVPVIHEVGFGIIPSKKHKYLGYYIMENLSLSGFQELSRLITEDAISEDMRKKIMTSVYFGLKKMRDSNIVFSDFHLDNVFANSSGGITWIDTGVTTYNKINDKKFRVKFNHSINRYIFYCNDRGNTLTEKETSMFTKLIISNP